MAIRMPQIRSEWEVLHLADGSLLFNAISGKQLLLRTHAEAVRRILRRCDGTTPAREICPESALAPLIEAGILGESLEASRPDWLPPEDLARYRTCLEYLASTFGSVEASFEAFRKIRAARFAVIGAGGHGSLVAMMLAAAGSARVRLVDGDVAEESNLVRQLFYTESDCRARTRKIHALRERMLALNSTMEVETIHGFLRGPEEVDHAVAGADFVFLCADAPRILINRWTNEACARAGIPHIGAFAGRVGPLTLPGRSACFGCVEECFRERLGPRYDAIASALQSEFRRQYPSFVTGPVLVAHHQFREAIGFLTGAWKASSLNGVLRIQDGLTELEPLRRSPSCPVCSTHSPETGRSSR